MFKKFNNGWWQQIAAGLQTSLVIVWTIFPSGRLNADQDGPAWWYYGDFQIISGGEESNLSPANLGQAKNVVLKALEALEAYGNPLVAGKIRADLVGPPRIFNVIEPQPDLPVDSWFQQQRAPLLVGQLKALALPFYDRLNVLDPVWLDAQRAGNQTQDLVDADNIYPWTSAADDDENFAVANIGQLKAAFAFRFEALSIQASFIDENNDGLEDTWVYRVINYSSSDAWASPSDLTPENASQAGSETGNGDPPVDDGGGDPPNPPGETDLEAFERGREAFINTKYLAVSLATIPADTDAIKSRFIFNGISDSGFTLLTKRTEETLDDMAYETEVTFMHTMFKGGEESEEGTGLFANVDQSSLSLSRGGGFYWYEKEEVDGEADEHNLFTGDIVDGAPVSNGELAELEVPDLEAEMTAAEAAVKERASSLLFVDSTDLQSIDDLGDGDTENRSGLMFEDGEMMQKESRTRRSSFVFGRNDSNNTYGLNVTRSGSDLFYGGVPLRVDGEKLPWTVEEQYRTTSPLREDIEARGLAQHAVYGSDQGRVFSMRVSPASAGGETEDSYFLHYPESETTVDMSTFVSPEVPSLEAGNTFGDCLLWGSTYNGSAVTHGPPYTLVRSPAYPLGEGEEDHESIVVSADEYPIAINDRLDILITDDYYGNTGEVTSKLRRPFKNPETLEILWEDLDFEEAVDEDAGWSNLNLTHISNSGESEANFSPTSSLPLAAGTAEKNGIRHAILLLPVEVVPDYDRDGKIDSVDRGQVSDDNPFRWWVNDDDDEGEAAGGKKAKGDIPNNGTADHQDNVVDGMRDLVDFFPLHLDIETLLDTLPAPEHTYRLKHSQSAFKFLEIPEIVPDGEPETDGSGSFIRSLDRAESLAGEALKTASSSGENLTEEMLDALENGEGILLLEATKETTEPLQLEILKGSDSIATIDFPVRVSKVEDMYRHVDLRSIPTEYDGSAISAPASVNGTKTGDPGDPYPDKLTNGKYFAFVHGYNVAQDKARGWHAETFKRLHQAGSKARYVGVVWQGDTGTDYHKAVFQAFQTGDQLNGAMNFVDGDLTIAAHSLGNMVVSQAVQNGGFAPDRYYLLNAAVAREAYGGNIPAAERTMMIEDGTQLGNNGPHFRKWRDYDGAGQSRLLSPEWHTLFPANDNRSKLKWNGAFEGIVGKIYNFYSRGDEVVRDPVDPTASALALILDRGFDFSTYAWANQEYVKGGTSLAGNFMERNQGGWVYNYDPPDPPEEGDPVPPETFETGYFKDARNDFMSLSTYRKYTQAEARDELTDAELRAKPFFEPFLELGLFDAANGSALAGQPNVKYDLLARGLPALSFAAAANSIDEAKGNFDMEAQFRTDPQRWPLENHQSDEGGEDELWEGRWLHSDFKNVALSHVYQMFDQMIETGGLDQ